MWQRDIREPEPAPIVLAEARKSAKRGASGAARTGYVDLLAHELEAAILMPLDVRTPGQMEAVFERIAKDWDYSPERVTWVLIAAHHRPGRFRRVRALERLRQGIDLVVMFTQWERK